MSEHTQKAIEAEAEEWVNDSAHGYPDKDDTAGVWMFNQQKSAYIAGRSKSLERERELEEALRELVRLKDLKDKLDAEINTTGEIYAGDYAAYKIQKIQAWDKAKQLLNNH